MMGELIMRLFHARTAAHVLHLKAPTYSVHKALETFYEDVVDLADTLAESYQGEYGLIEDYPPKYQHHSNGLELMNWLQSWILTNRYECCEEADTHLQNIIDEVVALVRQTTYKLKFLK